MALAKCEKFTANIYDKNRCKNCYRPKEVHSEAALESNKVSRKISRCGYLFVAPESFDFKSPLDRTRVNTVPQGVIDMNKCADVYDAENITSHAHSIAIATADHVTFLKGSTKEETNRWYDILVMYPRSNTKMKHKRSPTFPQTSHSQTALIPKRVNYTVAHSSFPNIYTGLEVNDPDNNIRQWYHSVTSSPPSSSSTNDKENHSGVTVEAGVKSVELGRMPKTGRSLSMGEPLSLRQVSGMRNGEVASAFASSSTASRHEPQPLTYRGVRSLKHRHDKSYTEGLRKSSSLHDLTSSPAEVSENTAPLSETRSRSHSRDSLSGGDASEQWVSSQSHVVPRALSKSCSDLTDMGSGQPKTFFEFLLNEPPPKPLSRNSRYMRMAGIPQTRPIEEYQPSKTGECVRLRHKSGPTTDIEHIEANHVAAKAKFWEAKSSNSVDSVFPDEGDCTDVGLTHHSQSLNNINISKSSYADKFNSHVDASKRYDAGTNGISKDSAQIQHNIYNHGSRYTLMKANSNDHLMSNSTIKSDSHSKATNPARFASNTSKVTRHGRVSHLTTATDQPANTTTTNMPPPPPLRSSSQKYSASITSKTSIPTPTRTRSRLTRNNALSQDRPDTDTTHQGEAQAATGTGLQTRGSSRGATMSGSHPSDTDDDVRNRSPTSSLLLNGCTKNETDEHKMAKSDFTTSHVNDSLNQTESSSNTQQERSHSTVSGLNACVCMHACMHASVCVCVCVRACARANTHEKVAIYQEICHGTNQHLLFLQDLEYMKKGWLMKQGETDKEWAKFWFVLSGSSLKYYDDMEAEKSGHERGAIDLASCYNMSEVTIARKYAFNLRFACSLSTLTITVLHHIS
ncbi:hypothetical protein LSH36_129g01075 [Paralvinella palmiformis]|uniref:PH domain-containing protein n=1 Tax=Paralvinella palmiformis TaxID=53620 RepID=A0AAD9JWI0_9ANNE|nr:hypothetical protein LSH36_129g01075 [Paralvinella palmiformis]